VPVAYREIAHVGDQVAGLHLVLDHVAGCGGPKLSGSIYLSAERCRH
jgi:hypothetical protein